MKEGATGHGPAVSCFCPVVPGGPDGRLGAGPAAAREGPGPGKGREQPWRELIPLSFASVRPGLRRHLVERELSVVTPRSERGMLDQRENSPGAAVHSPVLRPPPRDLAPPAPRHHAASPGHKPEAGGRIADQETQNGRGERRGKQLWGFTVIPALNGENSKSDPR